MLTISFDIHCCLWYKLRAQIRSVLLYKQKIGVFGA